MNSKKYNNIKLTISIVSGILTFFLLLFFVSSGYSKQLTEYISNYTENKFLILIIYTLTVFVSFAVIFFPFNFYSEFYLEHKYNLSNQTFSAWLIENIKTALVGAVIGIPLLLGFYFVLLKFGNLWWLPFAVLLFFVSVILAQIVPVFILPLFYKITPIEDNDLKERILKLSANVKMKVNNVFQFDMSKNTKKANAAFTGLGKTKKILLGDTLLNEFTNDEIETVIAHELGHYKHKHIIKNLIIGTLTSFVTLYLTALLYSHSINRFGFNNITDIAALPVIVLWGMLIGIIQTPLTNMLSRKYEYEADEYAVKVTNKADVFVKTLEKLNEQNLGDKEPHPFVEWFFYSHPSIKRRTEHIKTLSKKNGDL